MPARTADDRIVAVFEFHDKFVAAGRFGDILYLLVGRGEVALADVFAHALVEQEVILRDVGNVLVELFERDFADVLAADRYFSAPHVPHGGDELCNRRFAAARRPDERVDSSLPEFKIDAVQDLFPLVVTEPDVLSLYGIVCKFYLVFRADKLRLLQNGIDLPNDDAYLADVVAVTHDADERREHAETQNNEHDELGEGYAALNIERNGRGQYRQKHGGKHRHCNGKEYLALLHPVNGGVRGLMRRVGELLIRICGLIERLDDLDAVDIFHGDGVEVLARAHIPLKFFLVADHHAHIHQKSHGDGDERNQPHPPIYGHYVYKQSNGCEQFGRYFGDDMCERRFDAVDTL